MAAARFDERKGTEMLIRHMCPRGAVADVAVVVVVRGGVVGTDVSSAIGIGIRV